MKCVRVNMINDIYEWHNHYYQSMFEDELRVIQSIYEIIEEPFWDNYIANSEIKVIP